MLTRLEASSITLPHCRSLWQNASQLGCSAFSFASSASTCGGRPEHHLQPLWHKAAPDRLRNIHLHQDPCVVEFALGD